MKEKKILMEIERMEKEILEERKQRGNKGMSSFSYHLYANKLQKYQQQEAMEDVEILQTRLKDIVTQHQINVEDNPFDDRIRQRAMAVIKEAEEWIRYLSLTE